MQYFRPEAPYFVGDCMPFFHDGTYHLIYLLDENHHQGLGGLGGHQWAHASSTDLINWTHHPLAIACDQDWEGSICTGSVFVHDGVFYAYYATRLRDRNERLSLAVSHDGVNFEKTLPNPFAGPEAGYRGKDYRDPFVFQDEKDGRFHMLVTASLDNFPLYQRGGCLAHLTSSDLKSWTIEEPFIVPGGDPGYPSIPECPDYFRWNDWYYLIFSLNGEAVYRMSQNPYGPWLRPAVDTFEGPSPACVMKTAPFTGNRRIGVAYLASRRDGKDDGGRVYAGNALFRELVQHGDGSLGVKFPTEMTPGVNGPPLAIVPEALTKGASIDAGTVRIDAHQSMEAAVISGLPSDARITMTIVPDPGTAEYGIGLRGTGAMETAYYLRARPFSGRLTLNKEAISLSGLDQAITLEIVMKGDIIDVCIDNHRCIIDRCGELQGGKLFVYARNGAVTVRDIEAGAMA